MSLSITLDGELMFPSKYIGAADLKGKDTTVTIANVQIDELMLVGGRKQQKPVLYFERTDKMMVVNKTNATIIADLHGSEMKTWIGKRITLYPTKTMCKGKKVDCVRVREQAPASPQQHAKPAGDGVPGVVVPRQEALVDGLPDVTKPEVFYEFMEQTAVNAGNSPAQFGHAMNEVGKLFPVAALDNHGNVARLKVARAAHEGRLDWAMGRING